MDTKKLVVGQDVTIEAAGCGVGYSGTVVEVAEWGVCVENYGSISRQLPSFLVRFDKEGKHIEDVPWYLSPLGGEYGPWCINPLPEGAQAGREQMQEERMREHQPFIAWWKSATYEQRLALATKYYTTRLAPPLRATFAPADDVAKISDISLDSFLMTELAKEA
jgi:hypothetical protein